MSIFASQFRNAPTYDVGLDTGTPSVGATVGKSTKSKASEPAKVGAEVGASAAATAAASEAASNASSQNAISSNGKAAVGSMSLANAGTASKLAHMEGMNAGAVNAPVSDPQTNTYRSDNDMFDTPVGPTPKEATVSAPSKSSHSLAASGGGGFFHDIANGFDTTRHAVSASTDWMVSGGMGSSPSNMGTSKTYAPRATTRSGVVEPSNVWNPTADTNTGGTAGIAPGVSSPSAMAGASSPTAISANPNYNEQQFGRLQGARNAAQSQVDNSNEGIWGDIGGEAESWLEKASKVATSPEGVAAGTDDG